MIAHQEFHGTQTILCFLHRQGTALGSPQVRHDIVKSKGLEFFLGTEQRLGIRSKIEALSTSERLGARGERTVETGSLEGLAIGPMRLPRMPVSIGRTSQEGETREGNAGNEVFRDLVVTLDYLGGEIIFER